MKSSRIGMIISIYMEAKTRKVLRRRGSIQHTDEFNSVELVDQLDLVPHGIAIGDDLCRSCKHIADVTITKFEDSGAIMETPMMVECSQ